MKIMTWWWCCHADDQVLGFGKEERKTKGLKALVWFWWIDETLSAYLVYQSVYDIGSTTLSGKANEDHDMMMVMP